MTRRLVASISVVLLLAACGGSDGDAAPQAPKPDATTVAETLALGRPVVLAHASGENIHPHSSPYGYAEAVKAGVDILDMDVQLTKDGVLIIQHDDSVDRTTESVGKIAEMTFDEIHALDNAYWFTNKCTCKGEPDDAYLFRGVRPGYKEAPEGYTAEDFAVAKFSDIAAKYPDHLLNIEIKGTFPDAVPAAQKLADELAVLGAQSRAVVTSFDDEVLAAFAKMAPDVELTPGLDATSAYVLSKTPLPEGMRILQVPPEYEGITVLTDDLVARAHADGYVLWIWPNERKWENAEGYRTLLDMGVDGINAADPPVAVEVAGTD